MNQKNRKHEERERREAEKANKLIRNLCIGLIVLALVIMVGYAMYG